MNNNTKLTSVLGDPEKIAALKKMGSGAISEAFRIGCDIKLGISTDNLEELTLRKIELEERLKSTKGELSQIDKKIIEVSLYNKDKQTNEASYKEQFEFAVSEYIRCSPQIVYKNMYQLCEYLAGLLDYTTTKTVRDFYGWNKDEPSELSIRQFLEDIKEMHYDN